MILIFEYGMIGEAYNHLLHSHFSCEYDLKINLNTSYTAGTLSSKNHESFTRTGGKAYSQLKSIL